MSLYHHIILSKTTMIIKYKKIIYNPKINYKQCNQLSYFVIFELINTFSTKKVSLR